MYIYISFLKWDLRGFKKAVRTAGGGPGAAPRWFNPGTSGSLVLLSFRSDLGTEDTTDRTVQDADTSRCPSQSKYTTRPLRTFKLFGRVFLPNQPGQAGFMPVETTCWRKQGCLPSLTNRLKRG